MATNRGKQFEDIIKKSFQNIEGVSIDRIHDQTNGYLGSSNICDFIVYKKPYEYYIECKSVHGNTLPFANISKNQWEGMLEKSKIKGVHAGVICWWVDRDVTLYLPIEVLNSHKIFTSAKSIRYDAMLPTIMQINGPLIRKVIEIKGKKKRVFFDYDMEEFFKETEK